MVNTNLNYNSNAESIKVDDNASVIGLTEKKEYIASTKKSNGGILETVIKIPAGYSLEVFRDGVKQEIKPDCKMVNFAEGEHGDYQFKLYKGDTITGEATKIINFKLSPVETTTKIARITKNIKLGINSEETTKEIKVDNKVFKIKDLFKGTTGYKNVLERMDKIDGFQSVNAEPIKEKNLAIVNLTNADLVTQESKKFFDGLMITEEGKELFNAIGSKVDTNNDGEGDKTITAKTSNVITVQKDKEYKLVITFKYADTRSISQDALYELTLTANNSKELETIKKMLDQKIANPTEMPKSVTSLIGNTRFDTAIEVSKELYPEGTAAAAVVLVQKVAIVDGLAATPLAKSDNKENLDKLRKILQDVKDEKFNLGVNAAQTARSLSGNTRFDTAIEVSKELYPKGTSADAIVLVQKDAIVDGLAATPLATAVKAPILFTETTSVPAKVVTEIKRALNIKGTTVGELEKKTIYVVGGTTVIEPAVEAQLKEIGVTVKRIEGKNRMETSVSIAEEMKAVTKKKDIKFDSKAFIVGRNGEADAMSIAGYAAQKSSPIIVADANGLTERAAKFIEDEMKTADIIGGDTVVKPEIKDELVELLGNKEANVERVEGKVRSITNANVINKYYKGGKFKNVYVAKNGQGKVSDLADSLVAGPLAANNEAPIVLATTDLSVEQSETLDLRLNGNESLTQVGGGVSRTIIEKIAIKLGLAK